MTENLEKLLIDYTDQSIRGEVLELPHDTFPKNKVEQRLVDLFNCVKVIIPEEVPVIPGPNTLVRGKYRAKDERIKYTGTWIEYAASEYYMGTAKGSKILNDYLELEFLGTGVIITGQTNNEWGTSLLTITNEKDNLNFSENITCNSLTGKFGQVLFSKTKMTRNRLYKLKLQIITTNKNFIIDSIQII